MYIKLLWAKILRASMMIFKKGHGRTIVAILRWMLFFFFFLIIFEVLYVLLIDGSSFFQWFVNCDFLTTGKRQDWSLWNWEPLLCLMWTQNLRILIIIICLFELLCIVKSFFFCWGRNWEERNPFSFFFGWVWWLVVVSRSLYISLFSWISLSVYP